MSDRANGIQSKRIDDYQITYSGGSVSTFFGLPLDAEVLGVLDKYKCGDSFGSFATPNAYEGFNPYLR